MKLMSRVRSGFRDKAKKKPGDLVFWVYIIVIAIACTVFLMIRLCLHPVTVVGTSMCPTYNAGTILATKAPKEVDDLHYDDIIVFRSLKEKTLIKRVVGLPGDIIQIRGGLVIRNGRAVVSDFDKIEDAGLLAKPYIVPDNAVIALGDNRNHSTDSRVLGAIEFASIRGVVFKTLIEK